MLTLSTLTQPVSHSLLKSYTRPMMGPEVPSNKRYAYQSFKLIILYANHISTQGN